MVNEEVFDDEFYQEDFSSASELEQFIARLSDLLEGYEVLEEDPLQSHELSFCDWLEESEEVLFNDFDLIITKFKAKTAKPENASTKQDSKNSTCQVFQDLMSIKNDYCVLDTDFYKHDYENLNAPKPPSIHHLAVWYGLREFVVIKNKRRPLNDYSKMKLLQSSINLAVFDSKCKVPVFMQVLYKEQDVFLGIFQHGEQRVSFDIVHLKTPPTPSCRYLSGLLEMFKEKVGVNYVNQTAVSACLSYSLKNFLTSSYSSDKKSDNDDWDLVDFIDTMSSLPFGVSADPVGELVLYTRWSQVSENVVFDSPTYTDFNPLNSPHWSIRVRFDYTPVCYLADYLHEFLTLSESPEALSEYYNFLSMKTRSRETANPFTALTDSRLAGLSNMSLLESGGYTIEGPINETQIRKMFNFLFPNDEDPENKYPYVRCDDQFDPQRIKSAAPDTLVHRLAILLASVYTSFSGRRGVAQFWTEFSQKLRKLVEKNSRIPGVAPGFPDMRSCLLHQKLQMLNICMERKNIREGKLPFSMLGEQEGKPDSDDEFFDCDDDRIVDDEKVAHENPWNPTGRSSKLGKMLLIEADEPLYIPVTQEPVPKTEDELEDDAEMLLNVSDSDLRAQIMSATLISDMESFKAANPKAKLEDFIRWYSPRDWIEEDCDERDPFGRKGHLSERMNIPGNTWQTVWLSSKAVPARRQKRLFDDTKEAEKVLHFFESQTLGNIGQMTVNPLFHSALVKLQKEVEGLQDIIPNFKEFDEKLKSSCCMLSREKWNPSKSFSKKKWEMVTNDISEMELSINQARSILKKLYPEKNGMNKAEKSLINSLMKCHETELAEGAKNDVGVRVMFMFNLARAIQNEKRIEDQAWSLPDPIEKQFTLRLSGNTVNQGAGGPQFLRAMITSTEFRLCGAFSQNTTFAYSA